MYYAGVDIGSTTSKCVIIDDNQEVQIFSRIMTEFDRDVSGEKVFAAALAETGIKEEDVACVVATGYGRKAFQRAYKDIPEISAHAIGTVHLYPGTRTIIDIGGQDSKVIDIDANGIVSRFEMNDKCAAGTGRFFEVLTHRLLGVEMRELEGIIAKSTDPVAISSMCTIFAETEIISHLSEGMPVPDIAAGTAHAIARRIITQGKGCRIPFNTPIVFTGGVANNRAIADIFAKQLGKPVQTIESPQSTAALGAALQARLEYKKGLKAQNK